MTQPDRGGRNEAISLAEEDRVREVLADAVLGLWDVVNGLTRLRPSKRDRYRVTIFGSARLKPGSFGYEETKRCAAALAEMGCDIITGGGPGLMRAANEGAAAAPERARSIGIRVDLPFEQEINSFVGQTFEHRTFFTRLHQFVLQSDAFIVAPGGHRDGAGDADDLAAPSGEAPSRNAADPYREDVARVARLGEKLDARGRAAAGVGG